MKKITTWTAPCGCVLNYMWDDQSDEKDRIHTYIENGPVPNVHCPLHQQRGQAHFDAVVQHCKDMQKK